MKKIIFLDIDGVLNVISQGHDRFGSVFHSHFVDNLKMIIQETNADIVISSTWRVNGLSEMKEMWSYRGLPGNVIDITPVSRWMDDDEIEGKDRGYEIKYWLEHHDIDNYVIIDDDDDMLVEQMSNFVKTSGNDNHSDYIDIGYGLTKECSQIAINILNGKQ